MSFTDWAGTSDALLVVAIVGYIAAMALHAAELVAPARVHVTAGAGVTASAPVTDGHRARLLGRAALAVTAAAVLTHLGCAVTRALAAGRVPWGNMYEFIVASCLIAMLTWLAIALTRPVRAVGLFVTLTAALLLGGAGRAHVQAEALMPALQSPWLRVHVAAAALATGLFLIGFVVTALYLLRTRHDADPARHAGTIGAQLPAAVGLDRIALRMHVIAFPIWTFAIATGAIWAEAAWGRYWGWDPKETWAFVSWALYACYLHARTTTGWRGKRAAALACAAWASMLINVFAVNILVKGLHSYAGW
ncbi:c-type cytochrome biogenesis protein CcsB [Catellatospora sichuanensis]|uniref:c-type cytochrome biogenesis protein CcsB n=1 Tax=Catellatospora sichuanensis TaxID=1969805 RepID=UPI0011837B79|nr:c-type cytochrome biogenesis protein CcsB [Catellatospora sichuanensis]